MGTECPPIFPWAALRVADAIDPAAAGDDFLRAVYPALKANYDYWWKNNAVKPDGLFTGGFLGMDNLPRAKGMAQADASAWMAFAARNLAAIADRLGDPASATRYRADVDRIAAAVNANLWDEQHGFYYDLDADGTFIPTRSYTGLIPLIAGIVPADRLPRVLAALDDPAEFLSPYGIRSTSAKSVLYEPGYSSTHGVNSNWLGPVWIPINYLLVQSLADVDPDLARTVRESVVTAVEADWTATGRIHEYYDAETGEGIGADAQTGWSALVANLIAEGWPAAGAPAASASPAVSATASAAP
jgi:glycogen debranching enzyme